MLILNDTYIDMVLIDVVFYVLENILKMLLHLLNQLTIFVCKEKGKRREREGKEKKERNKKNRTAAGSSSSSRVCEQRVKKIVF